MAVVEAFDATPGAVLTASDIRRICYPSIALGKKHHVAARRAANALARTHPHICEFVVGRHGSIYTDATRVRSLAIGRIYKLRQGKTLAECETELDDPTEEVYPLAQHGGYLWLIAERNRLWGEGNNAEAAALSQRISDIEIAEGARQRQAATETQEAA